MTQKTVNCLHYICPCLSNDMEQLKKDKKFWKETAETQNGHLTSQLAAAQEEIKSLEVTLLNRTSAMDNNVKYCKQLEHQNQKLIDLLERHYSHHKKCGHDFTCVCLQDESKRALKEGRKA